MHCTVNRGIFYLASSPCKHPTPNIFSHGKEVSHSNFAFLILEHIHEEKDELQQKYLEESLVHYFPRNGFICKNTVFFHAIEQLKIIICTKHRELFLLSR